jgi:HPt (histidine-containing phosphotransfer) domain-containing protein
VLKALVGDDPQFLQEILSSFRASAQPMCADMQAAFVAGDLQTVSALAHGLKSASHSVGAMELGWLCAELEPAGAAGDHETVAQRIAELEVSLAAVGVLILEFLESRV